MAHMIFLGAGASKAFGYPTTLDFYAKAKKVVGSSGLFRNFESFVATKGPAIKVDIEVALWELEDLERTLKSFAVDGSFKEWLFFRNNSLGSIASHRETIQEVSKIRTAINKLVYETYWGDSFQESNSAYKQLFKKFGEPLDIFTTNYDLCLEHFFWDDLELREKFSDGFSFDQVDVYWNRNEYEHRPYRLFKLHGSLNWKSGNDGKILRFNRKDVYDPSAHIMLYPGFKGKPETEPYKTIHEFLSEKLQTCEKCLVIGFSFRDENIKDIFRTSLTQNKGCEVLVWDPTKPTILFESTADVEYFEEPFSKELIPTVLEMLWK
jgi:hypothetical protein